MNSNTSQIKPRNRYLDVAKAFAILLVVIGHCIQYGSGRDYMQAGSFFDNPLFEWIYSFHMPLFMLISGYLFTSGVRRDTKEVVVSKTRTLVVPIFCLGIIQFIIYVTKTTADGNFSLLGSITYYVGNCLHSLWFLWAVFWCSMIVLAVHKRAKDSIVVYLLIFIASFYLPDTYNIELYKYMYPYFVMGYMYSKYGLAERLKAIYDNNYFPILIGVVFMLVLQLHDKSHYIYISGHTLIDKDAMTQLNIDTYRYIVGVLGSIFVLSTLHRVYYATRFKNFVEQHKLITEMGRNTLGIYVISIYVNDGTREITRSLGDICYPLLIVEVAYTILLSMIAIRYIQRHKHLNRYLLGGK